MKALIGHEFSHHTFERYTTSKKHTEEFMKWKYKVHDSDIKKLNYEFITDDDFGLSPSATAINLVICTSKLTQLSD